MKLAEITGEFTFGLVTLLDQETSMEFPDFASSPALFTSGTGVLVVKVLHGQEGQVVARVWDSMPDVTGPVVVETRLQPPQVPSGSRT